MARVFFQEHARWAVATGEYWTKRTNQVKMK